MFVIANSISIDIIAQNISIIVSMVSLYGDKKLPRVGIDKKYSVIIYHVGQEVHLPYQIYAVILQVEMHGVAVLLAVLSATVRKRWLGCINFLLIQREGRRHVR